MKKINVNTVYQTDPLGVIPGGIDTFIRGIICWAPDDIEINIVGGTTDRINRPLFKWTKCLPFVRFPLNLSSHLPQRDEFFNIIGGKQISKGIAAVSQER